MKLIRDIGTKEYGGQLKMCSLFLCPVCDNLVEKRKQHGKVQKHCGCSKHGLTKLDEYRLWSGIKRRCYNPNEVKYKDYGGRGIKICDEWENNPSAFISWCTENGYRKGLQIDRVDNDGNYTPLNCEFVTNLTNARHKRSTVLSLKKANEIRGEYKDKTMSYSTIGKIYDVDPSLIRQILLNKIWRDDEL